MKRRTLLTGVVTASIAGVSGCSTALGSGSDPDRDETATLAESATTEPIQTRDESHTETDESSEDPPEERPSVLENRGAKPSWTLTVDCTVLEASGEPAADTQVVLADRGGTPDDRVGRTDADGRLVFLEGVGPPPCNRQRLAVPSLGVDRVLGCNNGGKTIEVTLTPATGENH